MDKKQLNTVPVWKINNEVGRRSNE
jgi:hypothetical protein